MYFWAEKENFASMKRLEMIVCRCVLLWCSVALVSCNKDMFDEEEYIKLVEVAQPVSGIDASHDWDLTASYNMTVTIGSAYRDMSRLQILSENPASGRSATLLGDYLLSGNEREAVTFTAPRTMTKFYAALVDSEGRYNVAPFTSYDRSVDFSDPLVTNASAISTMTTQAYTYCFEDEMPQPGDYDYNDVVLRISQERTAKNQITLNVTLAAVGSLSQVAAAIRLVGYTYDQIESITTVDGVTFDEGYKKSSLPFIDSNELLVAGSDNAAVITGVLNFFPYSVISVSGNVEFMYLVSINSESRYLLVIAFEFPAISAIVSTILSFLTDRAADSFSSFPIYSLSA